jgi:hypothetical protein
VLEHVELDLGLRHIETSGDCLLEASLRVRKIFVGVLRISEDADMSTTRVLSVLLRNGMQVEHRPAGDQKLMDVAQGVHDALTFDSSQRPGEEGEVEASPRDVDLSRADGGEGDAIREVEWQSRAGSRDLVGIGVDGEDGCGRVRVAKVARLQARGAPRSRVIDLPTAGAPDPDTFNGVLFVEAVEGAVWATVPGAGQLWRIDPDTNASTKIDVPYFPAGVAVGRDAVWVTVRDETV